jgi:hypothetical protein
MQIHIHEAGIHYGHKQDAGCKKNGVKNKVVSAMGKNAYYWESVLNSVK